MGALERREFTAAVTAVALDHLIEHFLLGNRRTFLLEFLITPRRANPQICVKKKLELRVRKDRGADIASFHHHSAAGARRALQFAHSLAHDAQRREPRRKVTDLRLTDLITDIVAVQKNFLAIEVYLEARKHRLEPFFNIGIIRIDTRLARRNRDRAVHRTRVQVRVAELVRQLPRGNRLSRADRAINRDYWPTALHLICSRICFPRLKIFSSPALSPASIMR